MLPVRELHTAQEVRDNAREVISFRRSFDPPNVWQVKAERLSQKLKETEAERDNLKEELSLIRIKLA